MKKIYKTLLIVLAVLIVLVLSIAIAASPVAKNYIEKHDRELLGRSIRMERLRMNIFTGRLRVEGLKIGGSGDSTTFFALDSFDMRMRILPLLSNRVTVKHITFAGLDVKVYQRGNTEHLLALRTEGTASLADFVLTDPQRQPVAGLDTLGVKLAEGDLGRMRFRFERFYAGGFSLNAELTPEGDNISALMKPAPETPEQPAETAAEATSGTAPVLQIADLEIAGGRISLRDLTMEKPFEYVVSDIRMRSRDFDPSKRNSLQVDARMQRTGSAKLRWEGTLDDLNNQSITLWLSNLNLRDFSPYCEHFTAYPVTDGNLTFRSQNVIRNRYLDGTNHLDAFEPKVDKKRKELKPEMNIPLKLGLYVLRDKKGHVKMDLPVGGNLDSPEFSYRKIVLKAIGNVLLKVVTAPFSFLSGGGKDLEYIALDPAQYAFTSEQYASFDQIAQMLKEKPEMQIALTQRINLDRALPAQSVNLLRLAYHNSLAAADSTGRRPRLSMLEYEKLQQIDIRTPAVGAFADSLLALRGISPQGMSPNAKALALYREDALGLLRRMMAMRDKALGEYMLSTHGVQAPAFRLQPMDSTALTAYAGRDRYTLALGLDGETVEIGGDTADGDAPADAGEPAGTETPAATAADSTAVPEPERQESAEIR